MRYTGLASAIAAMAVVQTAGATGNTPITTPAVQARSVLYALTMPNTMINLVNNFDFQVRPFIESGFRQLAAGTTVQALLASPRGIVVACPQGGTLTARMSRGVPRVLSFEWAACQTEDAAGAYTLNGPAEATLLEATLTPKTLFGVRMGNSSRDAVRTRPGRPGSLIGETEQSFNLRMTGIIPQRKDELENFPGYTFEVTGLYQLKTMRPNFSGGVPSVELYPFLNTWYADHALVSRQLDTGYDGGGVFFLHEVITFAWGVLGSRADNPQRPTIPASSRTDEYRGLGVRVHNFSVGPDGGFEFDGKLQINRGEQLGLGCTAPEVFSFRTRVPVLVMQEFAIPGLYRQGEINVNGSTTMTFSLEPSTSTNPFEQRTRVDVTSPALPPTSYLADGAGNLGLRAAARCTP